MKIALSDNIRRLRKERSLTQEQLAETLGVTVGAVYKWEAGLSVPELQLLIELADFFDVSVDALLSYELRNNSREATVRRLKELSHEKSPAVSTEAEKALKKYPNCFAIVYRCAKVYRMAGMERSDRTLLERAVELFYHACRLLDQNTDPQISQLSIQIEIAETYLSLNQTDEAVALLRENNPCHVNDALIGLTLATTGRPEEALPHLSLALLNSVVKLFKIAFGYGNAYVKLGDRDSAAAILRWTLGLLPGLKKPGETCFMEKTEAMTWTFLALIEYGRGNMMGTRDALAQAYAVASAFDGAPCYEADSLRFMVLEERGTAHDDMGDTALAGVERTILQENAPVLTAIWKEVSHENH